MNSKDLCLPIQDVFLPFPNKLQEANDFSEQPIVVSTVIDEFCNEEHFFETSEVEKIRN